MTALIRFSKPCDECREGFLGEFEHVDPYSGEHLGNELIPCPSCVGGWLPDDETVEATAAAEVRRTWADYDFDPWEAMDEPARQVQRLIATAGLVAAARYQSEEKP